MTSLLLIYMVNVILSTNAFLSEFRVAQGRFQSGPDPGIKKFIQCFTSNPNSRNRMDLYLGLDDLVLNCTLIKHVNTTKSYSSLGLRPTLTVYNSTNTYTFPFKSSTNEDAWHLRVPRISITVNTEPAPVDEFHVELSMFHGVTMLSDEDTVKGTLLDVVREPMLQWTIGEEISTRAMASRAPQIIKMKVAPSPCAADVAVLAPVFAPDLNLGVVLGVTRSAFTSQTRWFNVTKSLCRLRNGVGVVGCRGISTVDLELSNTHLFVVTDRGLFISQDLRSAATGPLKFILQVLPVHVQLDYSSAVLCYSSQCITEPLYLPDERISIIAGDKKEGSRRSGCMYSGHPFGDWSTCRASALGLKKKTSVMSFLFDLHQDSGLLLSSSEEGSAVVSVFGLLEGRLNPRTKFPPVRMNFKPVGMLLHTKGVFVYGSEVWASSDRGSNFRRVVSLKDEIVTDALGCPRDGAVVLGTNRGRIYVMKQGSERFVWLNETLEDRSFLVCDHVGSLLMVTLDPRDPTTLTYRTLNVASNTPDVDSGGSLAVQYITERNVALYVYVQNGSPSFPYFHVGEVIRFRAGGEVLITGTLPSSGGFAGVVLGDVLKPIEAVGMGSEPMQREDLLVERQDSRGFNVSVQLVGLGSSQGFGTAHIGMTVVAPGASSYLITGASDNGKATAVPTVPALVPPNITHRAGHWHFVSAEGKTSWGVEEGRCRHIVKSLDGLRRDAVIRVNVRDVLNYTFKASVPGQFDQKKSMTVALTNPSAMQVTAKHSWDVVNNHMITITVHSHRCKKVMTVVTVFVPEASQLCSSSTFSFTLINACPEGLRIVYLPADPISEEDWLLGNPYLHRKTLFDLPVNYMPPIKKRMLPSESHNVYNADPSSPMLPQRHPDSKNQSWYKQCAGKKSADECGCTDSLRLSTSATTSDCRRRVQYVRSHVLNLTLYLRRAFQPDMPLRPPYFVTVAEINGRASWDVTGGYETSALHRVRKYISESFSPAVYNPEGLQISFSGFELYHFRISVIPDVVLCDLVEEIVIYVEEFVPADLIRYSVMPSVALTVGILALLFFFKHKGVDTSRVEAVFRRHRPTLHPAKQCD